MTNLVDFTQFKSLNSFMKNFKEDDCKAALMQARWMKDGELDIVCPYCDQHRCHIMKNGHIKCNKCKRNFTETTKTIFASTKITLYQWFIAMYLISSHKKGISSYQLARDIDVTQKSAYYILQKIRGMFYQDADVLLEEDKVELDETYIGGAEKNKHENKKTQGTQGRSTKTKTPVFGMAGKKSRKVAAKVVKDTTTSELKPIIKRFCNDHAELFTDEHNAYNFIDKEGNNIHHVVNHKQGEYSKGGDITTNMIEGFWGHFKRMIDGIYHHVSKKQLQRYVDEEVYRWNTRKQKANERFIYMFSVCCQSVKNEDIKKFNSFVQA